MKSDPTRVAFAGQLHTSVRTRVSRRQFRDSARHCKIQSDTITALCIPANVCRGNRVVLYTRGFNHFVRDKSILPSTGIPLRVVTAVRTRRLRFGSGDRARGNPKRPNRTNALLFFFPFSGTLRRRNRTQTTVDVSPRRVRSKPFPLLCYAYVGTRVGFNSFQTQTCRTRVVFDGRC